MSTQIHSSKRETLFPNHRNPYKGKELGSGNGERVCGNGARVCGNGARVCGGAEEQKWDRKERKLGRLCGVRL